VHYLTSLAASNIALLILLGWSFDDRLASAWLPVTAVPYYALYAADLRRAGYRVLDVLRVYALNMLLIPVSLGGVLSSLWQACTGRRSAFARTPKVTGRTAAPAGYVAAEITLFASWLVGAAAALYLGHRLNAAFALTNGLCLLYALVRFIGLQAAWDDLWPLRQALRGVWAAVGITRTGRAWRLASPAMVLLSMRLLLLPTAVTGSETGTPGDH
jgi:hypothetical protein